MDFFVVRLIACILTSSFSINYTTLAWVIWIVFDSTVGTSVSCRTMCQSTTVDTYWYWVCAVVILSICSWRRLFKSRLFKALTSYANIYFTIFIAILVILFLGELCHVANKFDSQISSMPLPTVSVCLLTHSVWHDISALSGAISVKLGTNIHHMNGHCLKFQDERSKVIVDLRRRRRTSWWFGIALTC